MEVPVIVTSPPDPPNAGTVAVASEAEPVVMICWTETASPEIRTEPPFLPYRGPVEAGSPPFVSIDPEIVTFPRTVPTF
jgi:hypothetical protein